MKHKFFTTLLVMLMSMMGSNAFAGFSSTKVLVNGLYYNLDNEKGLAQMATALSSEEYTGDIVIPSTINYNSKSYNVTSIGQSAFSGCSGLTSITIPNSVTSIGSSIFYGCNGLTSIIVEEGNSVYDSRNNCNAIIKTKNNSLVAGCKNTVIPNSVTSIGDYAFNKCGLTSITIPESVKSITSTAFSSCSDLASIVVECGNTIYDTREDCNAIIKTETNELIAGCKNTIIPNSVKSIGYGAFNDCSGLTSVTIPNSVTSIGGYAFWKCSALTSITIPNSVTSIDYGAFWHCSSLTSVTIPNSVTSIGDYAFSGCSKLTSVVVNIGLPLTITSYTFSNRTNATLYVPEGSEEAYKSADYWKEFKAIKTLDPNVAVTGMSLTESNISIDEIGKTHQLTATILPSNATNKTVNWVSTNTDVCTVSSTGLVTATGEGECYVIATTADGGYTAYCTVNVTLVAPNVTVTGITLNPSVLNFKRIGGTKQIVANVLPADATNKSVNWMSVTPTVCSVSETGLVTALGSGNGVVIATTVDGGKMAYCTINVTPTDHATITMGSNGIATFSDEDALDFTSVSGLKAYIGSGYNPATGDLTMTRVYEVPAGEGLILKGAAGSYDVPYEETSAYYANLLVGVPTATTVSPTDGSYTNFILANDAVKGIGFYPMASAGEIGANKAYLQLPTSILPAAARSLRMVFEDEEDVTGINALNENGAMRNEKFFDLQGRRVVKPTRGLYIKDGKKIMVK